MKGADRVDPGALVGLLGAWADGDGPLYRQLADRLAELIGSGELPDGTGLPAERALADALPAARSTVVAALGILVEAGRVERRQGSGSVVRSTAPGDIDPEALAAGIRARSLTGRAIREAGPGTTITLGLSVLDDPESLPAAAFEADPAVLGHASRGHGYAPLGIPALRDRVAELLTARGVPTTAAEVAITLGVQHGIGLAADVLARPGDRVVLEDPTYPGAIDAYSRAGLSLAGVRVDAGGIDPGSLRSAMGSAGTALVHLSPQCASPTGVVTTPARLDEIAHALADSDAWLVEDAALQFLVDQDGQRFLTAHRPDRSVLLGSVSKVFWGGLRVGWLRGPEAVVERVGRFRAAHDLGSSIAPQVTALRLLDDVDDIGAQRRHKATHRREYLSARLTEQVPGISIRAPEGGLSLWMVVPRAEEVVAAAARLGLDVVAGPVCSISNGCRDRIRMSAWAPTEVLDAAVERLAAAVEAVGSGPPDR